MQESYFLSETVKYLYLTFTEGSDALLDYFIFSTEGHVLPPLPPPDEVLCWESWCQGALCTSPSPSSGTHDDPASSAWSMLIWSMQLYKACLASAPAQCVP